MTAIEQHAKKIFDKMYAVEDPMGNYPMCFDTAKQCALIAVDFMIGELDSWYEDEYYRQVRNEIVKL